MIEIITPSLSSTDMQCTESDVSNLPTDRIAAGTTCNVLADDGTGLKKILVFQNGAWVTFS